MSGPTRKAIAAALLAQAAQQLGTPFVKTGRRINNPEGAASPNNPGFFLVKPHEKFDPSKQQIPNKREFFFIGAIYLDVGEDETAIPADVADDLVDYVEAQLMPALGSPRQTLGGLVQAVLIEEDLTYHIDDKTGKGEVLVPIRVIVP